jgi:hypothetical protein
LSPLVDCCFLILIKQHQHLLPLLCYHVVTNHQCWLPMNTLSRRIVGQMKVEYATIWWCVIGPMSMMTLGMVWAWFWSWFGSLINHSINHQIDQIVHIIQHLSMHSDIKWDGMNGTPHSKIHPPTNNANI